MRKRIAIIIAVVALAPASAIVEGATASGEVWSRPCEVSIPGLSLKVERQLPAGYYATANDESGREVVCR